MASSLDPIFLVIAAGAVIVSIVMGFLARSRSDAVLGAALVQVLLRSLEVWDGHYRGEREELLVIHMLIGLMLAPPFGWLGHAAKSWQGRKKRG